MPRLVPLADRNNPLLEQVVALDGSSFTITFDWSARTNTWSFRINDDTGALLTSGGTLVPFTDLLRHVAGENRPGGSLFVVTLATGDTPTLDTLQQAQLLYYTAAELGRG